MIDLGKLPSFEGRAASLASAGPGLFPLAAAQWSEEDLSRPLYTFAADGGRLRRRDLLTKAGRLASALRDLDGGAKRPVIIAYRYGPEFVQLLFACLMAGIPAVPVVPPGRNGRGDERFSAILADSGAEFVLAPDEEIGRTGRVRILDRDGLARLAPAAVGVAPLPGHADVALVQYTSGSTGTPRGVVITHAMLMANLAAIVERFALGPEDRGVIWLPPQHDMGLIGGILVPAWVGHQVLLMSPTAFLQRPLAWLRAISEFEATVSGGPNFAYDLCVRAMSRLRPGENLDLSRWRVAFCGAEPVRAETLDSFARAWAPHGFERRAFLPCYGLAECTLFTSGTPAGAGPGLAEVDGARLDAEGLAVPPAPDARGRTVVGCGPPARGHQALAVDPETGIPVPPGRVGELWVRGPSVAPAYWKRVPSGEDFAACLADGSHGVFLRTGDMGFLRTGEVYVTGRRKELIIVRGRNLFPGDIERIAQGCDPEFAPNRSAAFGTADAEGEGIVLVQEVVRSAVRRGDWAGALEAVRRLLVEEVGVEPAEILLVAPGGVELTTSGKPRRLRMARLWQEGGIDALARWSKGGQLAQAVAGADTADNSSAGTASDVRRWLASWLARNTGGTWEMDDDLPIEALGLDSLMAVTITADLSDWLGHEFPAEFLGSVAMVGELVGRIAAVKRIMDGARALPEEMVAPVLASAERADRARGFGSLAELPPHCADLSRLPEIAALEERRRRLFGALDETPYFVTLDGPPAALASIGGRPFVNFSSHNYLGFANDPEVVARVREAVEHYGTGTSASRLISGQRPLHVALERAIADFIGVEDAITFVGGNLTNVATVGHLFGPRDLILYDELAHDSLLQGARLSGASARPFPHNDWRALDRILAEHRLQHEKALVFIEGLYSMDGDIPDLPAFVEVKSRHKALLMVDECISVGVLGDTGRGIAEHFGLDPTCVDLWMGGLSKALASCGGYVAGARRLIDYMRYTTPGFVFTIAMSPANTAAALAALDMIQRQPERLRVLRDRVRLFRCLAQERGLDVGTGADVPIVPVMIRDQHLCLVLFQRAYRRGFNIQPILPPAVAEDGARLRFFLTVEHTEEQIRDVIEEIASGMRELSRRPAQGGMK